MADLLVEAQSYRGCGVARGLLPATVPMATRQRLECTAVVRGSARNEYWLYYEKFGKGALTYGDAAPDL